MSVMTRFEGDFQDFLNVSERLNRELEGISQLQAQNAKDITDLYHIIECLDLSASKASKVYKLMKNRLQERRELKEVAFRLNNILGNTPKVTIKNHGQWVDNCDSRVVKYKQEAQEAYNRLIGE